MDGWIHSKLNAKLDNESQNNVLTLLEIHVRSSCSIGTLVHTPNTVDIVFLFYLFFCFFPYQQCFIIF